MKGWFMRLFQGAAKARTHTTKPSTQARADVQAIESYDEHQYSQDKMAQLHDELMTPVPGHTTVIRDRRASTQQATIKYRPDLVPELKDEHRVLVARYLRIGEHFDQSNFDALQQEMKKFRADFNAHVVKENLYFYVYLEQTMGIDNENRDIIREFRREMNHIARVAKKFIVKYSENNFDNELKNDFINDYEKIKGALVDRIHSEENSLYQLYVAPEEMREVAMGMA